MAVSKVGAFFFLTFATLLGAVLGSVADCTFVTSEGKTIDLSPLISKE